MLEIQNTTVKSAVYIANGEKYLEASNSEQKVCCVKQAWSFFFKPRRISAARIKRIMITNGSLVDLFKLVIAFHRVLILKELLGIFEISVWKFMRNGCHVGLVPLF